MSADDNPTIQNPININNDTVDSRSTRETETDPSDFVTDDDDILFGQDRFTTPLPPLVLFNSDPS